MCEREYCVAVVDVEADGVDIVLLLCSLGEFAI
jgi:hypothetical protein